MRETLVEPLAELLGLLLYAALSVAFTVSGVVIEHLGVTRLATHPDPFGIWLAYMGALGLYAGVYLLGYRELVSRAVAG
jgi:hypothetical protein